jgi:hypothetical protein
MRISADQLSSFSGGPRIPPPVDPPLSLTEEVVLLSFDSPRRLVKHVAKLIGRAYPKRSRDYDGALHRIQRDALEGQRRVRFARVKTLIGHPGTAEGQDAELLVLLLALGALPVATRADHLRARATLTAILSDPPPAVVALLDDLALEPDELVERLLPARRDSGGQQFGSSVYPSLGGV